MTKHFSAGAFALAEPYGGFEGRKDEGGGSSTADMIKTLATSIKKDRDQMAEDLAKLQRDAADKSKTFDDFKTSVDVKLTEYNGNMKTLGEQLNDIALKASRAGNPDPAEVKTLGQIVAESENVKNFRSASKSRAKIDVNGSLGLKMITSLPASAGTLIPVDRQPGVVQQPRRRMTIRGLIAAARTTSNVVEFVREKTVTNNAALVAEGAEKPESDLDYEPDSAKVVKIAHWIHVTDEALADAPALAGMIDSRLRYGLNHKEEQLLLTGSGLSGQPRGLLTAASTFARPVNQQFSNVTRIDTLRIAALISTVNEYSASGFVLNPIDWCLIEMAKDTQGRYVVGDPLGEFGATLWGLPVAATNAMQADNFLTGAFDMACQIFDRTDPDVFVSTEDRDNFIKNLVTVLAEQRLAMVIYQAGALTKGTFTAAKAALEAAAV